MANKRAVLWDMDGVLVKKNDAANPKLKETLLPAQPEDVLEADEMTRFSGILFDKC
jgi:beta-phosphoglucomutase-like phosphatase (HAD superfamily)